MDFGFSSNENQRYGIRGGLRIYIYCGINLEQQQMVLLCLLLQHLQLLHLEESLGD